MASQDLFSYVFDVKKNTFSENSSFAAAFLVPADTSQLCEQQIPIQAPLPEISLFSSLLKASSADSALLFCSTKEEAQKPSQQHSMSRRRRFQRKRAKEKHVQPSYMQGIHCYLLDTARPDFNCNLCSPSGDHRMLLPA